MKKSRQLFPGANTPQGFYSFYREGLNGLKKVFILKGGPGVGKSTLMRKIGSELANYGYATEIWQCSSDSSSIDGIICREAGLAVIDGTAPHIVDPCFPGVCEEIINLGEFWNEEDLQANGNVIISLFREISQEFAAGYQFLQQAAENRCLLQEACSPEYDERLEQQIFSELFAASEPRSFFSSAITDKGIISYVQSITAACKRRFLLSGMHNKNAALLLAKISEAARERGLFVEEYHSPFEPQSLELLVLPGISTAVIDATQPHIRLLPQAGDIKKDLSLPLPQHSFSHEQEYQNAFEEYLDHTAECFRRAKEKHDKLEAFYTQAMDFDGMNIKAKELINKIMLLLKEQKE